MEKLNKNNKMCTDSGPRTERLDIKAEQEHLGNNKGGILGPR